MILSRKKKEFAAALRPYFTKRYRDFPWRRTRNPYHILVSEIMLQQTQATRVVGYYQKFIQEFPDFFSLAKASPVKVLSLWQGLGYNRRALYLQRCAKMVIHEFGGKLPSTIEELVKLPGVGENTAGAIAAYAFNLPALFIETNIRKAVMRHFFLSQDKVSDKHIRDVMREIIDYKNPRRWYLAVVDYGAQLSRLRTIPNSRSSHHRPPSRFKGSFRQMRGSILRFLLERPRTEEEITAAFLSRQNEIPIVLEQLRKEGFVLKSKQFWCVAT